MRDCRRLIRLVALSCLLAAIDGAVLRAQGADTAAFPPVPSTVPTLRLRAEPADSGFGAWRRVEIPRHDKTPAAWTLRAGDWDFLMGTPRAMDAMDSSRIIDTTLANCRRPLNISSEDSARFAVARPWAAFDALADDRPVLVISIMPVLRNFTECGFKNLGRPAMIRRGMRFVTDFAYDPSRDPTSAVLLSQLRIVKPAMLAIAPVMVMSRGGMPGQSTSQLRLYIPYDAIAPTATGDMPQVELMIWTKAGGEPDHIPLPNNILHTVWWEYLRWRSARLASRDKATMATPAERRRVIVNTPAPTDAGLVTALVRQREGRDAEATGLILERLTDDKLSFDDRRIALMSLAATFQADDDQPAAAMAANELTAMDPCALSGSGNSGGVAVDNAGYTGMRAAGSLLDHTRGDVRCFSYRPGATFLRGLTIPGNGQYTTWSHLIGRSVGAVTIVGAAGSAAFLISANSYYKKYQTTLNGDGPPYFQLAVDKQTIAKSIAIATGVFWVATALEAELQERIHASRLDAVHNFWFRPITATSIGSTGGALGMAGGLTFSFR